MKEIVLSLMVWIGVNTDYVMEVPHPTILRATQADLQEKTGGMYGGRHVLGVYMPRTRTVYLDEGVDENTPSGKSTIVHELVHHYQAVSRRAVSNACLFEAEAYSIEDKWRRQNKLPEIARSPSLIYWMGKCVMEHEYVP